MSSATWTSNLPDFHARHERAMKAALIAAVLVVENEVKRRLMKGYTTGAYSNRGRGVAGSVTHSEPALEDGDWTIRVGTNRLTDRISPKYGERISYALAWEVGHFNLFTGQYERVEVWRPALMDTRIAQANAFNGVYRKVMTQGLAPDRPGVAQ